MALAAQHPVSSDCSAVHVAQEQCSAMWLGGLGLGDWLAVEGDSFEALADELTGCRLSMVAQQPGQVSAALQIRSKLSCDENWVADTYWDDSVCTVQPDSQLQLCMQRVAALGLSLGTECTHTQ